MCDCDCDCGCAPRKFYTKEEKLEMLKEYKEALVSETKGVEERIKDLQKKS